MKKVIRIASLILALVLCIGAIPLSSIQVSAASNWPSLSASSYCEFKATKTIYVYRNSSCSTRGTSSPAKSYNAYIETGDVCKILSVSSNYILVKYPVGSSYRTGYIKQSALFGVSAPTSCVTSKGKATTYVSPGGNSYGYTESGDKVYTCGTSGNYTLIIYTAKSGSRAYKLGYVKTSDLQSKISSTTKSTTNSQTNTTSSNSKATDNRNVTTNVNSNTWKTTVTIDVTNMKDWYTQIRLKETELRGLGRQISSTNGTWVESNIITGCEVLSYRKIKVFVPSYGPSTPNSPYGKTVYVNVPYKIRYTIHRHDYGTKSNAQYWGNFLVGLVNLRIVHTQQCSCGKAYTCTWEMPEISINKVNAGQTYTVTSRVYSN